jgi:asparagine synthetase B (glutamine-hydrolysing)
MEKVRVLELYERAMARGSDMVLPHEHDAGLGAFLLPTFHALSVSLFFVSPFNIMCGIFCSVSVTGHVVPSKRHCLLLEKRGPDSSRELRQKSENVYLTCFSTVLALRGDHTVVQPVQHSDYPSAFLCWNGEAWKYDNEPISGNDSDVVFANISSLLLKAEDCNTSASSSKVMQQVLNRITGPYAFVYYDPRSDTLFFGRDPLGRRSLMYRVDESGNFILSTISGQQDQGWAEVEADGIYSLDLKSFQESSQQKKPCTPICLPYISTPNTITSASQPPSSSTSPLITSSLAVAKIEALLRGSLHLRISNIPTHTYLEPDFPAASLAILFSGGLDCTLLARLSNEILDPAQPIDLLNVAFENPRVHRRPADADPEKPWSPYELCPDRITGRASFAELQAICPGRLWRFVAIDIPYTEFLSHKPEVISLIYPHNTEMDLSIASALYFASRGRGLTSPKLGEPVLYKSQANVLLSGLGADELFGGYTRHDTAFRRHGFSGLKDELDLDVDRLGKRNLGRDDRVLSSWARETRFPFLDEDLVRWAVNAPVWERCGFGEDKENLDNETGSLEPAKKLLRCLAWKLGMKNVAAEKKRAVSKPWYDIINLLMMIIDPVRRPHCQNGSRPIKGNPGHYLKSCSNRDTSLAMRRNTSEALKCTIAFQRAPHLLFLVSLSSGL